MQLKMPRLVRVLRTSLVAGLFVPLLVFASQQDARTLWVTVQGSVLKVAPADGSTSLQLASFADPQALAVDNDTETVKANINKFGFRGSWEF